MGGVLGGLWHAHTGWLLSEQGRADWKRYAPDLYEDQGMRRINRHFVPLVVLGLAIPALAGYLLTGTLLGAATGLLWGGLVRVFFVHHVTWSVNSVCHFLGTRRFEVDDQSHQRLLARPPLPGRVLAPQPPRLPPLGRPRAAPLGARPLRAADRVRWRRLGLAWNVIRIPPERQAAKAVAVSNSAAAGWR